MLSRRAMVFAFLLVGLPASLVTPAGATGKSTATVPGAPTITAVTAGRHGVSLSFTPPASTGGARILHYRARCTPLSGGSTKTGFSHTSPLFVGGLAASKSYSCTLAASNHVGFGPASTPITTGVNPSAGTRCATETGTATFTPPLPGGRNKALVDTVLTWNGTIAGCSGGGVTSATTTAVSAQINGVNCDTFAAGRTAPIVATLTITWNTQATSAVTLQIQSVKRAPTSPMLVGTVTAGLFKGLHEAARLGFSTGKTGCITTDLSTLPYKQLIPTVIA